MTESEMLELAAKAAGIDYKHDNADWKHADHCAFWDYDDFCTCGARWNPRNDDGDAFQLMVKLGLLFNGMLFHYISLERFKTKDVDDATAIRRAITSAAAEIGRNMT